MCGISTLHFDSLRSRYPRACPWNPALRVIGDCVIPCDEGISLRWRLFPLGSCQTERGWLDVLVRLVQMVSTGEMVARKNGGILKQALPVGQERGGAFLATVARTKYARAPAPKAAAIPT
jgi:hypothetical protein